MDGLESVEKLLSEGLAYVEHAQETLLRLRTSEELPYRAEAAQLVPLAQGLCSYAQRFSTTLQTMAAGLDEATSPAGRKRKEREAGNEPDRATTPDAAEALTALQGLEGDAEETADMASLLAEPRELDSASEDEKQVAEDPLAGIPLTSYAIDHATGEAVDEKAADDGVLGASSDSADLADLKKCNCKKSRCLKLYCECFSSGVFCESACMCVECLNIVQFTDLVTETRKHILDRSPNAFAPKVSSGGSHKKGCHCKKSRCLKKYCECYQANVPCTEACKCENCENTGPNAPRDDSPQESYFEKGALPTLGSQNGQGRPANGRGSNGSAPNGRPPPQTASQHGLRGDAYAARWGAAARFHVAGALRGQDTALLMRPEQMALHARAEAERMFRPICADNRPLPVQAPACALLALPSLPLRERSAKPGAEPAAAPGPVQSLAGPPTLRRSNRQAYKMWNGIGWCPAVFGQLREAGLPQPPGHAGEGASHQRLDAGTEPEESRGATFAAAALSALQDQQSTSALAAPPRAADPKPASRPEGVRDGPDSSKQGAGAAAVSVQAVAGFHAMGSSRPLSSGQAGAKFRLNWGPPSIARAAANADNRLEAARSAGPGGCCDRQAVSTSAPQRTARGAEAASRLPLTRAADSGPHNGGVPSQPMPVSGDKRSRDDGGARHAETVDPAMPADENALPGWRTVVRLRRPQRSRRSSKVDAIDGGEIEAPCRPVAICDDSSPHQHEVRASDPQSSRQAGDGDGSSRDLRSLNDRSAGALTPSARDSGRAPVHAKGLPPLRIIREAAAPTDAHTRRAGKENSLAPPAGASSAREARAGPAAIRT